MVQVLPCLSRHQFAVREESMKKTDNKAPNNGKGRRLRSLEWFDNPHNPGMTALYLERYLNYGLTREELQSGKPIIGIAQTGNDLSPCNRHHLDLAKRVREGIRAAGGIAMEFPTHPIQETGKRPTAAPARAPWCGSRARISGPERSTTRSSSASSPRPLPRSAIATPWAPPRP